MFPRLQPSETGAQLGPPQGLYVCVRWCKVSAVGCSLSRASVPAVGNEGRWDFGGCARHASVPPKGTTFLSWYPRTFPSPCCLGVELPWSSSWEDGGVVSGCGEEWRPRDGPGCASVMSSPGGEAETPAQASRCSLCPHFYSME